MADIARLGVAVDTANLVAAQKQLEKLSVESAKAEVATKKLEKAHTSAALAAANAASAEASAAAAIARSSKTMSAAEKTAAADAVKTTTAALNAARATDAQAAASLKAAQAALMQSNAAQEIVTANEAAANSAQNLAHANDNAMRAMGRTAGAQQANMSNIAAQFQDIGVTAAMGMNPMMIGLQQGAQLMGVWGSIAGTTAEKMATFGSSLQAVLSPMSLVIIGLTAGLAALIQLVDWTSLAKSGLMALASGLEAVAPYAAAAGATLLLAFSPVILGAIWSVTAAIVTGFIPAIWGGVTALVALAAANPFVALILGIAAIVTAAYMFRDELKKIFGFDIIKVVKDVAEYIIDAFTAAFKTIGRIWEAIKNQNGSMNIVSVFSEEFAKAQGSSAIDAGIKWGTSFVSGVASKIRSFATGLGAPKVKGPKGGKEAAGQSNEDKFTKLMASADVELAKAQQENTMIGMTGQAAKIAAAEYDLLNQAKSQGINLAEKDFAAQLKAKAALIGTAQQVAEMTKFYNDRSEALKASRAELETENAVVGMSAQQAELYRYKQELLNDAKLKGITLSGSQVSALMTEKSAQIALNQTMNDYRAQIELKRSMFRGFIGDLKSGLLQGQSVWEAWGNAALKVMDRIIDKLLDEVVNALFKVSNAGSSGGILNILSNVLGIAAGVGSVTHGFSGTTLSTAYSGKTISLGDLGMTPVGPLTAAAKGAAYANGTKFYAKGGSFTNSIVDQPTQFFAKGGAPGVMGEAGPEAIMPLHRGPDGSLGVQMLGNSAQAQPAVVHIVPSEYFNAVVDQRSANVAGPMVVQGSLAATQMSEQNSARRARRSIP